MKKKIIIGLIIACVYLWLLLHNVNWAEFANSIAKIYWLPVAGVGFAAIVSQYFRVLRWSILLSPIKKVGIKELFAINGVGFLTVNLLPFRIGEVTRPLLLKKRQKVSFANAFATVVVERVLDVVCLAVVFGIGIVGLSNTSNPSYVHVAHYARITALVGIMALIGFVVLISVQKNYAAKSFEWMASIFPEKIENQIKSMLHNFFEVISNVPGGKNILLITFYSIGVWGASAVAFYLTFRAFDLDLPWSAMFMVMGMATIGASIPIAPGSLGTYQMAIQPALSLYLISPSIGVAYAIVTNVLNFFIMVLMGIACLSYLSINISSLFSEVENADQKSLERI